MYVSMYMYECMYVDVYSVWLWVHLLNCSYFSAPLSKDRRVKKGFCLYAVKSRPTLAIHSSPHRHGHWLRPLSMSCTSCSPRRSGVGPLARPLSIGQPSTSFSLYTCTCVLPCFYNVLFCVLLWNLCKSCPLLWGFVRSTCKLDLMLLPFCKVWIKFVA